jgi:hypothetical protein
MSVSASSTSAIVNSRDQTTNFMMKRLRDQQLANPSGYVNDNLYEFFQNITIAGAGVRTCGERRGSHSDAVESIGMHFTSDRVSMAMNEWKEVWPPSITIESIMRTHLKLRTRKLTDKETKKLEKVNEDRRKNGIAELSAEEVVDLFNPKLSDADLWARYKALRSFTENVIGPAYKACLTKSTKDIPSGKQLDDILLEILDKCWENKEEIRINHLEKSRAAAATKATATGKAVDSSKYRSTTDIQDMPPYWFPTEFGPWLLRGDMADDRHPNFCLDVAGATEGAAALLPGSTLTLT